MDVKDLLNLGSGEIRKSEKYINLFTDFFEKAFGYRPNCRGCSFKSDFNKLKNHIFRTQIINNLQMENHEINRRQRSVIHTYVDDKGKAQRSYGKNMTDEFAENFLSKGTKEQLSERRKLFVTLPKGKKNADPVSEVKPPDSPTPEVPAETVSETAQDVKPKKRTTKKKK